MVIDLNIMTFLEFLIKKNKKKYKVDNMFVFNNSIIKKYSKYFDSKYFVIGSFRSNNKSLMNYKSKSNYIVFVSEFVRPDQLNKNYDYNTYYSREKNFTYLRKILY